MYLVSCVSKSKIIFKISFGVSSSSSINSSSTDSGSSSSIGSGSSIGRSISSSSIDYL